MLRKRTRSVHKDQMGSLHNSHNPQPNSDCGSESDSSLDYKNLKNNSFHYTAIPGLLVGLSPKGLALGDCCDSVRSPTSPLDFRLFSGLANPFRSSSSTQQRSWVGHGVGGGSKLGLMSIIDSLDDGHDDGGGDGDGGMMKSSGEVLRSSSSSSSSGGKNILFGPKLRFVTNNNNPFGSSSPKSLPKNYAISSHSSKPKSPLQKGDSDVLFEIGNNDEDEDSSFGKVRSCSLDSCRTISNLSGLRNNKRNSSPLVAGSSSGNNGFVIGPLSASEIELSEDYTCVISHGPNPKTTHIFGDCILETHFAKEVKLSDPIAATSTANPDIRYPSDVFLSFCYSCNKKLEEGKDIYIYRGEKAFCSMSCRSLEILIDEESEKSSSDDKDSENPLSPHDDLGHGHDHDHGVDDDDDDDDCKELFF